MRAAGVLGTQPRRSYFNTVASLAETKPWNKFRLDWDVSITAQVKNARKQSRGQKDTELRDRFIKARDQKQSSPIIYSWRSFLLGLASDQRWGSVHWEITVLHPVPDSWIPDISFMLQLPPFLVWHSACPLTLQSISCVDLMPTLSSEKWEDVCTIS